MSKTLELAKELISRPSVTPDDKGCQTILANRLAPLGFKAEKMNFDEVENPGLEKAKKLPYSVLPVIPM